MADKIVVMHDGIVEQIGPPLDLYDRPGQPLRRELHRLARHELAARRDRRRRRAVLPGRRRDFRAAGEAAGRRQGRAGGAGHPARASQAVRPGLSGRDRRRRADRVGNPDHRPHAGRRGYRREFPRAPRLQAGRDRAARRRAGPDPPVSTEKPDSASKAEPDGTATYTNEETQGGNDDEIHQTRCDPHDRRGRRGRSGQPVRRLARLRPGRADIHARGRRDAAGCCAGRPSSRATRTQWLPTPSASPTPPACRCASTRKAGRTSAPRRRWPPMSAPAPT